MNIFTADPRDAFSGSAQGCNSCCCGQATARPDETNKWMVNYAPWAFPLGGRGLTDRVSFALTEQKQSEDGRAPVNTNKYFPGEFNTPIVDTVATGAVNPLDGDLTYEYYQLTPPQFGELVFNESGAFTYTPTLGRVGYDTFYYITKNDAKQVINQVIVGIAAEDADPLPAKAFDKPLSIIQKSVKVDSRLMTLSFAMKASPLVTVGDIYRLEIKQPAIDCDCSEYTHVSCYDITIVTC